MENELENKNMIKGRTYFNCYPKTVINSKESYEIERLKVENS